MDFEKRGYIKGVGCVGERDTFISSLVRERETMHTTYQDDIQPW